VWSKRIIFCLDTDHWSLNQVQSIHIAGILVVLRGTRIPKHFDSTTAIIIRTQRTLSKIQCKHVHCTHIMWFFTKTIVYTLIFLSVISEGKDLYVLIFTDHHVSHKTPKIIFKIIFYISQILVCMWYISKIFLLQYTLKKIHKFHSGLSNVNF